MILSFCEFPVSSSLSCLDAAVSLMSPSVDACIQGNESLVLTFILLSSSKCLDRQLLAIVRLGKAFVLSFVVCIVNKMFSFGRRLG